MKKSMLALVAISLVALLAACEVSVYVEPPFDERVNADTWTEPTLVGANPTGTVTLDPGETFRYKVVLPDAGLDAVYYELDRELELTVFDRYNDAIASSASEDYFARGTMALASASATELEPADVTANLVCRGSCVIERRNGSPRYVRIRNQTGVPVTTTFYAILRDFEDTNESASEPLGIPLGGDREGALESLDDVDRYVANAGGTLTFEFGTPTSGLVYTAEIIVDGDDNIFLMEGESAVILEGEEVLVYAENGADRAGAASKSRYQLSLN